MSKMFIDNLNELQFDALKELANVGAGNATVALSNLLKKHIKLSVSDARIVDISQVPEIVGDEEKVMTGILIMLKGGISGCVMFLFDTGSVDKMLDILFEKFPDFRSEKKIKKNLTEEFNEMEISAIMEVGNIISGAYLKALSDMTDITINVSVPMLQMDMVGSIMSVPAIQMGEEVDKLLLIDTHFSEDIDFNGYYIFIPDEASNKKMLESLQLV